MTEKLWNYQTDMADEFVKKPVKPKRASGISCSEIIISDEEANAISRDAGRYTTIELISEDAHESAARAICSTLKSYADKSDCCLVVGLGNKDMTADSLGAKAATGIVVTTHMLAEMQRAFNAGAAACICPSVLGVTGIPSFDIIKGAVLSVKPKAVICVDSLAGRNAARLGRCFQITDTGIAPGSGIGLRHNKINEESLGVPVIAIGVPLVMHAKTIVRDAADAAGISNENGQFDALISSAGSLIVTPKEIDIYVTVCAKTIALGINMFIHPSMSRATLDFLMHNP